MYVRAYAETVGTPHEAMHTDNLLFLTAVTFRSKLLRAAHFTAPPPPPPRWRVTDP